MNRTSQFALLPLAAAAILLSGTAGAAPKPKVSKTQAEAIALKAAPGKIVESDYEKEDGIWRWSFDIRQGKRIHEIGIDAMTGKVVESSFENPGNKD
ncbi:PepSY domain-containing protein [Novosphingobium naphthalenivorans]|uniref:PepSY domain-containing protein n=1 Tax=Novosphingobium naphthalenivorans TaxID=273168 RepID=UPI00082ACB5C|nr:PepSY domain-containing protein [Novosphingobium naphthalenivorans]